MNSLGCLTQEFELGLGSDKLVRRLLQMGPDETLVISADTESDLRVVTATARAAYSVGARPLVVWTATPPASGKAGEVTWPVGALTALLKEADAWVEFNRMPLLYSRIYDTAVRDNPALRHLCLPGMYTDLMTRCIAMVDYEALQEFLREVANITHAAEHMRITTPAGGDVEFDNNPEWPVICEAGDASKPGSHMLPGQVGWSPVFESINGTIVFDGSVSKVLGLGRLVEPIELHVEKGTITAVEGGKEARTYEKWLQGFNDPQMLRMAHVCWGFHPNASLSGVVLEDERVWGATEWGIGNVGPMLVPGGIDGPSHSDGICLDSSVWVDGERIMDRGNVVYPPLVELARKLGK